MVSLAIAFILFVIGAAVIQGMALVLWLIWMATRPEERR